MESKKAKERLNSINKTQISMKNRELNFVPLRRGVLVPHGYYSFLFHCSQFISIIYFHGLTELCHFPFKKVKALKCVSTKNYKQSIKLDYQSRTGRQISCLVSLVEQCQSRYSTCLAQFKCKRNHLIYTNLLRRLPLSLSMTR